MAYEDIRYEVDDPVATIVLNRPEALNAWTPRMGAELRDAVARAESDRSVVGIVITGAGRAFCAGADLNVLAQIAEQGASRTAPPEPVRPQGEDRPGDLSGAHAYLLGAQKPVVAAINGPVVGMAVPIVLCCDIRFMAADATIITGFAERGVIAESGVSWLLPRIVGTARALDLLLSSRRVSGTEAAALGLVHEALPAADVLARSRRYVEDLAARCAPRSMAIIKRQIYEDLVTTLGPAERNADRLLGESFQHDDFKEGVRSFVEKRPPNFERIGTRPSPDGGLAGDGS